MREVLDSFIHLLADNLPAGITVHVLRDDPNDANASRLQENSVNISFLNFTLGAGQYLSSVQAVIDVVNVDGNIAVDWVDAVWQIMKAAFFSPIYDYSTPSAPEAGTRNMLWDPKRIAFKKVSSSSYAHY